MASLYPQDGHGGGELTSAPCTVTLYAAANKRRAPSWNLKLVGGGTKGSSAIDAWAPLGNSELAASNCNGLSAVGAESIAEGMRCDWVERRWSASNICKQESQLSKRGHAMHYVSWNLVDCCTAVQTKSSAIAERPTLRSVSVIIFIYYCTNNANRLTATLYCTTCSFVHALLH